MVLYDDARDPGKPDKHREGREPGPAHPGADPATAWMDLADCRGVDPDVFFPHDGVGVQTAARICVGCQVREPCLEFALANRIDDGVWGGLSERARRRLLAGRAGGQSSGAGMARWRQAR